MSYNSFFWFCFHFFTGASQQGDAFNVSISSLSIFQVFSGMLSGLDVIHKAGLIWKDVKLRNLLVSDDHSRVLIDDLETIAGVGKVIKDPKKSGVSKRYAAPEVIKDPANISNDATERTWTVRAR
jgi:serine/threonine protein kinase